MTAPVQAGRSWPARGVDPASRILGILLVVGIGVLAGLQWVSPDKRVLAVAMAALVFGVAWRLDTVSAIGLLVLALPYPRGTVFGSTNLALLLFVVLIWLLRARSDPDQAPAPTGVDVPLVGLLITTIVSFYNVRPDHLGSAFSNFLVLISSIALFYLVVNNIRTSAQLQRLHVFQAVSIVTIALLGVYEMNHPGAVVVPGWITLGGSKGTPGIVQQDARIGGPFFDYELLAEFSAICLLFTTFRLIRARTVAERVTWIGLGTLLLVILFATVTRGALVALAVGILYLLAVQRRHVRFVPLTIGVFTAFAVIQIVAFVVNNFSSAGDMFGRLLDTSTTSFVHGMPISRAHTWTAAFQRILEHPLIGHGPYYSITEGTQVFYWPHNGFLFTAHLFGFIGLGFFLWIVLKLCAMSWIGGQPLREVSYARGFLVIANTQLVVFLVDQLKIDYLRNPIYTYQAWLLFAQVAATALIVRREDAAASRPPA